MITLHEHPLSPYVRKVRLALLEKAVPYERVVLAHDGFVGPEHLALNPRGEVPALVDDGLCIFDSTVICEYLEERYPEVPLLPKTPAERARVRMVEDVADGIIEAAVWGVFEIRILGVVTGPLAETMVSSGLATLEKQLDWLERQLGDRAFFGGETFGLADCALVPHLAGAALFGVKAGAARPGLAAWVKRIRERASVQQDQALVRELMMRVAAEGRDGFPRVRQYRDHRLEWMVKNGGTSIVTEGLANGTVKLSRDLG